MTAPFRILPDSVPVLEVLVPEVMRQWDVKGLAVTVLHENKLLFTKCFGHADPGKGVPFRSTTYVEAASLTKTLLSWLVLRRVQAGEFDLDRPLVTYPVLPPATDPRVRMLTARHVLTHTTGFPNWGKKPLGMRFTPGARFCYSGEGFTYLQRVLEHVSGKRFDHLCCDEIFTPFGMDDCALIWTGALRSRMAVAHGPNGDPQPPRTNAWHANGYYEPNAAFSLYADIRQYVRFLREAIDEGIQALALSSLQPTGSPGVNWGLGWGEFNGALWHWGDNGGYKSIAARNAPVGDGLVVHTNSHSGLHACRAILDAVTDTDWSAVFDFIDTAE